MADAPQKPTPSEEPKNLDALAASEATGVVDAIERHRTKILAAIAISAIVLCGALVVSQLKKQRHLAAAAAYTSAVSKGEIAALDSVLIDHPGSIPAGNALLAKADLQIDQGKPEDARATLERFVAEFKGHPLYPHGLFALANVFHVAGDKEMAKSHYEKVIDVQKDGELTPLARIRLGDLALETGDTAAADQRYQEAYSLHPGTPFFDYAEEKLALLKVGNPPEVERPAPPVEENPKPETPKSEASATPDSEAPKAETPAPAPQPEAPKSEAPAAPAPEAPKAETPVPAAPQPEAPKPEAPAAPAPEAPKTEAPAPAAPAPAPEAPKSADGQ